MTTQKQQTAANVTLDAAESGLRLQLQLAETSVVSEARAMRRGGVGMGRLFDAIDALERLYDKREILERKRAASERLKRVAGTDRRVG